MDGLLDIFSGLGFVQGLVPGLGQKHIQDALGWGVTISHNSGILFIYLIVNILIEN